MANKQINELPAATSAGKIDLLHIKTNAGTDKKLEVRDFLEAHQYNTIAQAKADTNLKVGNRVKTWGYNAIGDGGGAEYRVVAAATGTDDGGSYHNMSNGNQLELITEGEVNVRQFGVKGDGITDDIDALEAAISYAQTNNRPLYFPKAKGGGKYRYTRPLKFTTNMFVYGEGATFSSVLLPVSCQAFTIDGNDVAGGFGLRGVVKDLTVDLTSAGTISNVIYLNDLFRCEVENIYIYNGVNANITDYILIEGTSFENCLRRVYVAGDTTASGIGCRVNITTGSIKIEQPDFENVQQSIVCDSGNVDIFSPHMERFGRGLEINSGAKKVNLFGGYIDLPSASSIGVRFDGDMTDVECNIYSPYITSNDTVTKKDGINTGAATGRGKINVFGVDPYFITDTGGRLQLFGSQNTDEIYTKTKTFTKNLADNVATDIADLTFSGNDGVAFVTVRGMAHKNGIGKGMEEIKFAMARQSTGSYYITPITSVANQADGSGNYIVSSFDITASAVGSTEVKITSTIDVAGGIAGGTTTDVYYMVIVESDKNILIAEK